MRPVVTSLVGFALVWTCAAAQSAATEPDTRKPDSPHSRAEAILNRISLPEGNLLDPKRRMGSKRAKFKRGKIEETYDKVLFDPQVF